MQPYPGGPEWSAMPTTAAGQPIRPEPGGHHPMPGPPPPPPHLRLRGLGPYDRPARHPWEIPLLVVVVMITGVAFLLGSLLVLGSALNGELPGYLELGLVGAPILVWFGRGLNFARLRTGGVKMSPSQFPEGYRMVQEAAARFGMAKAPDAYVVLGNGQINAFASGHGFRRFVAVYSDLFEVGGAAREPDALAFIIGHEVGHIAAGHTSYWRQLGMFVAPYLPIIGNSLIRSQEYTADNHGYGFRPHGALTAMGTLAAGKYLNTSVGTDEMADRAPVERGGFVWLSNAMSSHPVLTWRMWALRDRSRPGNLFWRPSPPPGVVVPPPGGYPMAPTIPSRPPKPTD